MAIPRLAASLVRLTAVASVERMKLGLSLRRSCNPFGAVPFPTGDVRVVHVFDYIPWRTMDMAALLEREVGWTYPEEGVDRFDCLLHPLDNYKWLKEAGVTKDGCVYSNMIRAGLMSREDALSKEAAIQEGLVEGCHEIVRRIGVDDNLASWEVPSIGV